MKKLCRQIAQQNNKKQRKFLFLTNFFSDILAFKEITRLLFRFGSYLALYNDHLQSLLAPVNS